MIDNIKEITKETLLEEVSAVAAQNARFVVMTCVDLGDKFEIAYYFSMIPSSELKIFRLTIGENEELPSITGIYICALLNENEFQEFYGVKISGLAINYDGHLFLAKDSPITPMRKNIKSDSSEEEED